MDVDKHTPFRREAPRDTVSKDIYKSPEFLKLTGLTSCLFKAIEAAMNAGKMIPSDIAMCL